MHERGRERGREGGREERREGGREERREGGSEGRKEGGKVGMQERARGREGGREGRWVKLEVRVRFQFGHTAHRCIIPTGQWESLVDSGLWTASNMCCSSTG